MMYQRGSPRHRSKHIYTSISQDGADIDVKCDQTLEQNPVHLGILDEKDFEACPDPTDSFLDVDLQDKQKCSEFLKKVELPETGAGRRGTVPEICNPRTSTVEAGKAAVGDTNMGFTGNAGVTSALVFHEVSGTRVVGQVVGKEGKCQEQRKRFPPQVQILLTRFEMCHIVPLILLALCVPVSFANPLYNRTRQELPAECMAKIKPIQECPYITKQSVAPLTNLCCANFSGTHLHCQHAEADGFVTWVFLACIEAQEVGDDMSVKLVKNSKGYSDLELIRCPGWGNERRMSFEVREPCIPIHTKIDCSLDMGRQMLCSGGGKADDKCVCAGDFVPANVHKACLEGFDSNSPSCPCIHNPCPKGYGRNNSIPVNATCDGLAVTAINYTCIPITTDTDTAPEVATEISEDYTDVTNVQKTTGIAPSDANNKTTSTTPSDANNKTSIHHVLLAVLAFFGVVVVLGLVVLICVRNKYFSKCNTSTSGTESPSSQSPSPDSVAVDFNSADRLI